MEEGSDVGKILERLNKGIKVRNFGGNFFVQLRCGRLLKTRFLSLAMIASVGWRSVQPISGLPSAPPFIFVFRNCRHERILKYVFGCSCGKRTTFYHENSKKENFESNIVSKMSFIKLGTGQVHFLNSFLKYDLSKSVRSWTCKCAAFTASTRRAKAESTTYRTRLVLDCRSMRPSSRCTTESKSLSKWRKTLKRWFIGEKCFLLFFLRPFHFPDSCYIWI